MKKSVLVISLLLIFFSSCIGVMGAEIGETIEQWTRIEEDLTYLSDANGRLHFFPIRFGNEGNAYCINPGVIGAEQGSYMSQITDLDQALNDENKAKVFRTMVLEGWRISEERGCTDNYQKYYSIQMALRSYVLDGFSLTGGYRNSVKVNNSLGSSNTYNSFHGIMDYCSDANNLIPINRPQIVLRKESETLVDYPYDKEKAGILIHYENSNKGMSFEVTVEGEVPVGTAVEETLVKGDGAVWVTVPKKNITQKSTFNVCFKTSGRVQDVVYALAPDGKQNTIATTEFFRGTSGEVSMEVEPLVSDFKIRKIDRHTGEMIPGSVFRIWSGNNGYEPQGTDDTTQLLGEYTTDEKGEILIEGLTPLDVGGYLYVQEIKAPPGYEEVDKSKEKIQKILFAEHGKLGEEAIIQEIDNEKKPPPVFKEERMTKKGIGGCEFYLLNDTGQRAIYYQEKGAIIEEVPRLISTENGDIVLPRGLKDGVYYLEEISAPEAYLPSRKLHKIEINSQKEVSGITIENDRVQLNVFIQKNGINMAKSFQEIGYWFPLISNESNCFLSNFRWIDQLDEKAFSLSQFRTGVYEAPEAYVLTVYDESGNPINVPPILKDEDDELEGKSYAEYSQNWEIGSKTKETEGVFINRENYILDGSGFPKVKSLELTLCEGAQGDLFTTGVFGKISYDVVACTVKGEVPWGENYSGEKENILNVKDLIIEESNAFLGYKIIFKESIQLENFTTGNFKSERVPRNYAYGVFVKTNLRDFFPWNENLVSNVESVLNIDSLGLEAGEDIHEVMTLFKDSVPPGFRGVQAPAFFGTTRDLEAWGNIYFPHNKKGRVFANVVDVLGEYVPPGRQKASFENLSKEEGCIVKNGDEWDTIPPDELKKLPKTGNMLSVIITVCGMMGLAFCENGLSFKYDVRRRGEYGIIIK